MKDRYADIKKVLLTGEEISKRTTEIAAEITRDYAGEEVLVVAILRGAVMFFAELVKQIDLDVRMDFMAVSSCGASTVSSKEIKINKDLAQPIEGLNVIIVEDIIDTGHTLKSLLRLLWTRNPKSIKVCALLDKPSRREVELEGDYVGFEVPNEFVVGYGLDYNEKYRNLPDVCVLKESVYKNDIPVV